MHSVKLQDTIQKNLLLFRTPIMNCQKEKAKRQTFKIASKRIKYLGINNQGGKRPIL